MSPEWGRSQVGGSLARPMVPSTKRSSEAWSVEDRSVNCPARLPRSELPVEREHTVYDNVEEDYL